MRKIYKASPRQVEDWYYNYKLQADQVPHLMQFSTEIPDLDLCAFQSAYSFLILGHESLRSNFKNVNGEIIVEVRDYCPTRFSIVHVDGDDEEQQIRLLQQKRHMRNLIDSPLIQAVILKKANGYKELIIIIHHIICDHASLHIIRSELLKLYQSDMTKIEGRIPASYLQLGEYFKQFEVRFPDYENQTFKYWQTRLEDPIWHADFDKYTDYYNQNHNLAVEAEAKYLNWRTVSEQQIIDHPDGEIIHLFLSEALHLKLTEFQKKIKASNYHILMACFGLLHFKFTGTQVHLIQSHFSNRDHPASQNVIGNLLGKLLLLNKVERSQTLLDYVYSCSASFFDSIEKQVFHSEKYRPFLINTRGALFINYISQQMGSHRVAKILKPFQLKDIKVESPFVCVIKEFTNTISFEWSFNKLFLQTNVVEYFAHQYFEMLNFMVENPDFVIGSLITNIEENHEYIKL